MENFTGAGGRVGLPENNPPRPRLLNAGCGAAFHPEWVNVDIEPAAPGVQRVDLRRELPFADGHFDAAYCSHVLEHLAPGESAALLARLRRVLRPGAVLRVVVPDLEGIARQYLETVEALGRGDLGRAADHEWMLLELFDQFARREPGGEMARYLAQPGLPNADFVRSRVGAGAMPGARRAPPALRPALRGARLRLASRIAGLIAGREAGEALAEGWFRQGGEVHRWMYDAHSLRRALESAGFGRAARRAAGESAIGDFARFRLDVDGEGRVRKPDSLFMEAFR